MARNDASLSRYTAPGPPNDTTRSPSAGPAAWPTLVLTPLSVTAARNWSRSTRSGIIACQPGMVRALKRPPVNTSRSSVPGRASPLKVSVARTMAVTNMQLLVTMRRRLRLRMSASTPPGTMSTKMASALAALMRATRRAEVVRLVICHWAASVCIQLPMLDMSEAMKRARKKGLRRGAVTGVGRAARSARGVTAGSVEVTPG